jgi:hypothetical protein
LIFSASVGRTREVLLRIHPVANMQATASAMTPEVRRQELKKACISFAFDERLEHSVSVF